LTGAVRGSRVLGVDLGSKRIGLALSDPTRTIASPLSVLHRSTTRSADHRALCDTAIQHGASLVVVGLPLSLSGRDGPAAKAARLEIDELRAVLGEVAQVVAFDERLTTVTAQRSLSEARLTRNERRAVVDKVAAAVMLQAFLDRSAAR
jgi:putative Holliday junction resolvase